MKCGRLFLTFLFIHACQFDFASSQSICLENGNYTTDSPYSVNLNRTLQSLEVNVDNNGFYNTWEGEGQDRANAMVLCRGDAQLEKCKNCTRVAAEVLLRACPLMKQAILWDELCMVRYSNETIDGVLMYAPVKFWRRAYNATSPDQFKEDARGLMDQLSEKAAAGDSLRKVAAGNVSVAGPDFQRIFALLQCTPDLSHADCSRCLVNAIRIIPDRCDGKRGCRVLCPSCNLRFEIYSFYDEERLLELEPTTVSLQPPSQASGNSDRRRLTIPTVIIIVVLAVLSLLLAVSAITVWFRKRRNQKPKENHLDTVDEMSTSESVQYDFSTIKAATNDFSYDNKLGQGGFGSVYKGKLPNGREIAVKRLSIDSGQGDLEFKNEVVLLAKLQHRNLVRLLGFAIQGVEKLLIYELVQNGSLDQLLFGGNRSYLDWDICYKIIGSIARGILYLHEDSRLRIIHRDLKASNILLDEEMNPKIADFGMAKLFGQDETHASTSRIVGTYGYMPPEYLKHGKFSIKSDVFSFGVLLLEIISGRRNNNPRSGESTQDLLEFAWKNLREGRAANVVDSSLRSNLDSNSMVEMVRCIHIGLLCVQENAGERPTMSSVVVMLSSSSIDMTLPSQPAFLFSSHVYDSDISRRSEKSERSSHNVDSVTELHPR